MVNVGLDDASLLQKIDDVCDAVEAGHVTVSSDQDVITGLFMTPSGAALLDSYSVLPATTA
jgi:hypothetical protein